MALISSQGQIVTRESIRNEYVSFCIAYIELYQYHSYVAAGITR